MKQINDADRDFHFVAAQAIRRTSDRGECGNGPTAASFESNDDHFQPFPEML